MHTCSCAGGKKRKAKTGHRASFAPAQAYDPAAPVISNRRMRILLLTRHFPPVVSGGARRPFLLARALASAGADIRVMAPTLAEGVRGVVVPHPSPAPASDGPPLKPSQGRVAAPVKDWVRANLLLPDPDIRWALRAVRHARRLEAFRPDWVLTTSPPESVHIAGLMLSRRYGCRWAADFRDHWLVQPLLRQREGAARRAVETLLAKAILSHADLLVAPEEGVLKEAQGYVHGKKCLLLPQPGPAPGRRSSTDAGRDETIAIVHTGSFSLSQDTRRIEDALAVFSAARAADPRFRLILAGRLTAEEARRAQAADGVELRGILSLEEAWRIQAEADILLLVAAPDAATTPGKLAEYRSAGRPIVCIGGGAWRCGLAGAERAPLEQLLALRDPAERERLAQAQAMSAHPPDMVAQRLLEAMQAEQA